MKKKKTNNNVTVGRKNISKGRDIWNRFKRNKNAVIGMIITLIFVLSLIHI